MSNLEEKIIDALKNNGEAIDTLVISKIVSSKIVI